MFEVEVIGDKQLDQALAKLAKKSAAPFVEFELGEALYKDFLEIEADEFQSRGHGDWPELADETIANKTKNSSFGSFATISVLRNTDALYNSLTKKGDPNAVLYQTSPTELLMGTRVPYARFHMKPYKKRPARPPIRREMRAEDRQKMQRTIRRQAARHTRDVGFTQTSESDFD
jgi:hypothetical protein